VKRSIIGAVLLAAAGIVLLSPAGGAIAGVATDVADLQPPIPGPPASVTVVPTLTASEEHRALEILAADRPGSQLLGQTPFEVYRLGPWTTEEERKIGASIILRFDRPITMPMGPWPSIIYDASEKTFPPYERRSVNFKAVDVRYLMIRVDLTRGVVVTIDAGPGSRVTPGPNYPMTTLATED
jgi:hypothetical protein